MSYPYRTINVMSCVRTMYIDQRFIWYRDYSNSFDLCSCVRYYFKLKLVRVLNSIIISITELEEFPLY